MSLRVRAPLFFAALLCGSGCAHRSAGQLTWDEVTSSSPPPRVASDAEDATSARPAPPLGKALSSGQAVDLAEPAGRQIDRALVQFGAQRVRSARLSRTSTAHGEAWLELLARVDEAVQVPPSGDDLGAFVRARVTLEVEYERDRQRKRLLPDDLLARIRRTLLSVDHRVDELRMSGAAGTVKPSPRLFDGDLILQEPLMPMVITSSYGVRQDPIHGARRFHAGIDVGAPQGTPVFASAGGLVIYAGWQGGYGLHVVLDHGDGVRTHYSHLDEVFVKVGQVVEQREVVATVGTSGRSTGPHLHFAVTNAEGRFLDPLTVLFTPFPVNVLKEREERPLSQGRRGARHHRLAASSSR